MSTTLTTVADTLFTPGGNIITGALLSFRPYNGQAFATTSSGTISGSPVTIYTDNTGSFSVQLVPGLYYLSITASNIPWTGVPQSIVVPVSSTPVTLATLLGGGVVATSPVYYGRSTNATVGQGDILGLTVAQQSSRQATYSFSAGSGYGFLAWPASYGIPPATSGFMTGAFQTAMAAAADGFSGTVSNGWTYQTVTVNSVSYYVFRTQNALSGAYTITVT